MSYPLLFTITRRLRRLRAIPWASLDVLFPAPYYHSTLASSDMFLARACTSYPPLLTVTRRLRRLKYVPRARFNILLALNVSPDARIALGPLLSRDCTSFRQFPTSHLMLSSLCIHSSREITRPNISSRLFPSAFYCYLNACVALNFRLNVRKWCATNERAMPISLV